MVQDKDKLKEVGLEPDKPAGHIRGIWALTLILAFAIVIVGGVYFILWYSPWGEDASWHRTGTTNETKDWQTYTNLTYDFSIKYPKDWKYKEYVKNFVGAAFYEEAKTSQQSSAEWTSLTSIPGDIGLIINKTENTLKSDLARFASEQPKCVLEDKKIADKDGKLFNCPIETSGQGTTGTRRWYLVEDNNVVLELFTADESKKDTLDKMVGTLTFGGATASPTATQSNVKYKTFSDKVHVDFSIEYPENLFAFGNISGEGYQGTVYILKQSTDKNEMERTNIQVYLKMIQPQTTDIRAAYKNVHGGDLSSDQSKFQNTTVAGVPALKYQETTITSYLFIKDNFLFEIVAVDEFAMGSDSNPLSDPAIKAAFDHIVSSFKFQ